MFVGVSESQKVPDLIGSYVRTVELFGGLSEVIVIDNLMSGLIKSCNYEPELNRALQEFGEHYSTSIMPTRFKKATRQVQGGKSSPRGRAVDISPPHLEKSASSLAEVNQATSFIIHIPRA